MRAKQSTNLLFDSAKNSNEMIINNQKDLEVGRTEAGCGIGGAVDDNQVPRNIV